MCVLKYDEYMMKTKDIVLICDDNYCLPTIVCIQSIIGKAYLYEDELTIHVCTFGLSTANLDMLEHLNHANVKVVIDLLDEASFPSCLNQITQRSHVTPTALIKFELPNYLKEIDSVLYLDSDIVVKGDLSDLLNLDIKDYFLAASYEFWEHLRRIQYTLHRSLAPDFYFNSGVMLMNLRKMREDSISEKLWEYKLNETKTTLMDQESLNALCKSNVLPLSIRWNFNPVFLENTYIKELNKVYGTAYDTQEEIEKDIQIIHYVGAHDKPWIYKNARMREYWDQAYMESRCQIPLQDKVIEVNRRGLYTSIKKRITSQGLAGTICYIVYLLELKFRQRFILS